MTIDIIIVLLANFFFIGPDNSYSVLLPDEIQLVQIDTLSQCINHTFMKEDSLGNFDYTLSLIVAEGSYKNLVGEETIKDYEEDCACSVVSTRAVEFRNFKGVEYSIEKEAQGISLGGKVYISEYSNGKSINCISMTTNEMIEKLPEKLEPILNTLVLNF